MVHIFTRIGIHWSWLVLSRSWDGDTDRWLLDTVVIVVEERNTFRNAVTVPVRWNIRLCRIVWTLKTILISWSLSQTVWTSPPRQIAHDYIVSWNRQHAGWSYTLDISISDVLLRQKLLNKITKVLLLTRVSPGTEGTLVTPGKPIQAATFSVCGLTALKGVWTHVVSL